MKKSVCLGLLLVLMLFRAEYVTEGAKNGLLLWYSSVVPALFPFMVLSGMIVAGGGISVLMEPFYRVLHPLLRLSKNGCYTLISGLFCGYPMGAKTCADFLAAGKLSPAEGRFLMAISNYPSPMFILGFVYPLFRERLPLRNFLAAVYGPALFLAAAAYFVYRPDRRKTLPGCLESLPGRAASRPAAEAPLPEDGDSLSTDAAILSAVEVLCKIGGYLMLYSIVIVFLRHAKGLPLILKTFLVAAMEMTTGIQEAASALPYPLSGAVSCAALAFGGFSGLSQTKAVIQEACFPHSKNAGLSIRQYAFWKALHGTFSAALFFFFTRYSLPLFP